MTSYPNAVPPVLGLIGVWICELDPDGIAGELHTATCLADDLGAEAVLALELRGSSPFS